MSNFCSHILKATIQALVQIIAQEAVQAAIEKDKKKQASGVVAAMMVGAALSAGESDTRMWSHLPGRIFMGRSELPKGLTKIVVPTLQGPTTVDINITQNYQVVHIRLLGGRAIVTSKNHPDFFNPEILVATALH